VQAIISFLFHWRHRNQYGVEAGSSYTDINADSFVFELLISGITHPAQSAGKNGCVPPLFGSIVQLVVLVSGFVMVSTDWSGTLSCLLFFYSRCPSVPYGVGANGHYDSQVICLKI